MTHSPVNVRLPLLRVVAMTLLLVVWGCGEEDRITQYSVPKKIVLDRSTATTEPPTGLFDRQQPSGSAWFFKLTGAADAVETHRAEFDALLESLRFDRGEPQWTLPNGWSEQSGSGMRQATFTIEGDTPLEVSVIKLPTFGSRDDYLKQNIDRWAGQLGLTSVDATETEERKIGDRTLMLVDLSGKTAEIDKARMLGAIVLPAGFGDAGSSVPGMSNGPAKPIGPPAASIAPPSSSAARLTYDTPDGWKPGKSNAFRVASFVVKEGDQQVEITIIPAGGDLLSNVNRWRGQVKLEKWTEAQLNESAKELIIDGRPATLVSLEGAQTIVAAVLPDGQQSWFFKMMGDPAIASREQEHFEEFVESVTFKK